MAPTGIDTFARYISVRHYGRHSTGHMQLHDSKNKAQ